jgi:hypothetical protein
MNTASVLPRCRDNDGAGKSATSWEKHELMRRALQAQAAKAQMALGGLGVIVDMHAHDGHGVTAPQVDLFNNSESTSSAMLAFRVAHKHGADLVLCEKNKERMALLQQRFGDVPIYLTNNEKLLLLDWKYYTWAIVLNDPNGHSEHAVPVMQHIARQRGLRSDFIVMVNESSLLRHLNVAPSSDTDDDHVNAPAIKGSRAAAAAYAWMQQPEQWRRKLFKRHVAHSAETTRGKAYRGRLLVLSDSLANLNPEMFSWCR